MNAFQVGASLFAKAMDSPQKNQAPYICVAIPSTFIAAWRNASERVG